MTTDYLVKFFDSSGRVDMLPALFPLGRRRIQALDRPAAKSLIIIDNTPSFYAFRPE